MDFLTVAATIGSDEALGDPTFPMLPPSISSDEAFGTPIFPMLPSSIGSGELLGSPLVAVHPSIITTEEAFGAPVVSSYRVIAAALGTTEFLDLPVIYNASALYLCTDATSDIQGGTKVRIGGAVLDMDSVQDDFGNSVLNPALWASYGAVHEAMGYIELDTGPTAGGMAGVFTNVALQDYDFEVVLTPTLLDPGAGWLDTWLWAGAPNNAVQVSVLSNTAGNQVYAWSVAGGLTQFETESDFGGSSGELCLRLIRFGNQVVGLVNGVEIMRVRATTIPAVVEFGMMNDVVYDSRLVLRAHSYVRRPVVAVDNSPITTYTERSHNTGEIITPAMTLPGNYDLTVNGAWSETLTGAMRYVMDASGTVSRLPSARVRSYNG